MGNNSRDKAKEEEDGWDEGLAGGHCQKSKELSSESLGLKQETGNLYTKILFHVLVERIISKTKPFLGFVFLRDKPSKREEGTKQR
jgi:hypothetical protein